MACRTFRSVLSDVGYEPCSDDVPEVSPEQRPRRGRAARITVAARPFDLFPHTRHVENVLVLDPPA